MRYYELCEAGVKTAEVDRAARTGITKHMPEVINAIKQTAKPDIGLYVYDPDVDDDGEERSQYYDRLQDWLKDHKQETIEAICTEVSRILTEIARDIAEKRDIGVKIDRKKIVVKVDPREYSDDKDKHHGGYHSDWLGLIKVFIDGGLASEAATGYIEEDLFGEDAEGYRDKFTNIIVPVFAHEYAHFEQTLRRGFISNNDLSHITIGSKRQRVNGKRRGNRGGIHRDTEGDAGFLRYMGSTHEIDAWASSAAAEMVQSLHHSRFGDGPRDFNRQIAELRQSIASGWGSGSQYDTYREKYYDSLEQRIPDLNHEQMTKVWHVFLRSLDGKLADYLHPKTGQGYERDLDPYWVKRAETYTMTKMFWFLAWVCGARIARQERHSTPERIERDIDMGAGGGYETGAQHKAENFIRHYYFRDWFEQEKLYDQYISIFRRMLKKQALESLAAWAAEKDDDLT
jgi:hypothetical protein